MVDLQYDQEHRVVIFTAHGALNLKDIVAAVNEWVDHEQFADNINMVWDLRDSSWQTAVSEFLLLATEITSRVNEIWRGEKVAWIVDTATEVALVDTHLGTLGWHAAWRGFTSPVQARAWLDRRC